MSTPTPTRVSGDELGTLLSQSFNLLFAQIGQYLLISLAAILPVFVVSLIFGLVVAGSAMRMGLAGLAGGATGLGLGGLLGAGLVFGIVMYAVSWVVGSLMIGAIAHAASCQTSTGQVSFQESYKAAWAKFWVLLVVLLIVGLAVGFGSMLLVLPGLAAFFFLCLAPIAVMVDGADIGTAITRSCQYALKVPLEIFVIGVIAFAAMFVLALIPVVGWFASCVVLPWAFIALTLAYKKAPV